MRRRLAPAVSALGVMKHIAYLIALGLVSCSPAPEARYDALSLDETIAEINSLPRIEGRDVGFGGLNNGRFYHLVRRLRPQMTDSLISSLMASNNPNSRIAGLLGLALATDSSNRSKLANYEHDTARVQVCNVGCVVSSATVGQIAVSLRHDPFLFGHGPSSDPYGVFSRMPDRRAR